MKYSRLKRLTINYFSKIRFYNDITPIFLFLFRGVCCANFYRSDGKCIGVYKHISSLNLNNKTILKDKKCFPFPRQSQDIDFF